LTLTPLATLSLHDALPIYFGRAQQLPRTAFPEHYDVHLTPDFATDTFQGEVAIAVRLTEPSGSITLNAAELELLDATITAAGTRSEEHTSELQSLAYLVCR